MLTITHIDGNTMAVRLDRLDTAVKDEIKALPGATYADGAWLLSPVSLPALKAICGQMTVEPAVVAAYHAALRKLCDDLYPCRYHGGAMGRAIGEILHQHANGIAAIQRAGYTPPTHLHPEPKVERKRKTVEAETTPEATPADRGLALWLSGAKNAHTAADKKKQVVAAKRRKKVAA